MREIVIVIRDLYLQPELEPASSQGEGATPGMDHLARFGDKTTLPRGWRAWTAHWLGLPQYAREPPASIAAAALPDAPAAAPADRAVWMATPLHLVAGLNSLHFDRRSLLHLPDGELAALAASFRETFRGSGFDLHPLAGGELLLSGAPIRAPSTTTEPARMVVTSVAESLPAGEGAPALRRLGAEIEMWLHGHPVNGERARRGAPPVASLWVWGGGAAPASPAAAARETAAAAFGRDAYVRGLWRLAGRETGPMPVDWAALIGEPGAQRALGVVEVAELLHANSSWTLADAVADIDRRLISPALAALHRGALDRLVLLANDRSLSLRAANRWRLWRRMRTVRGGFEALA
ncbi:MAG: hypothetical protein KGL45_08775 [Gammaproteobacteria bacterium]|nr:hypothetical protein [Gammaproteobacteria bacterium]